MTILGENNNYHKTFISFDSKYINNNDSKEFSTDS